MCLAVPGEVIELLGGDLREARVSFGGVVKRACLLYVPDAGVGSYVLVHAGFAIAQVSEEHAREALEAIAQLGPSAVPPDLGRSPSDPPSEPA